ncbi:MAG: Ppx/GppA phosphatase family protein [Pseudomonadota bacterium]
MAHTELTQMADVCGPAKKKGPKGAPDKRLYAAVDLGTNSCRMLIARPNGLSFDVVDAFSKPVYLGKGLVDNGALSRGAMDRTMSALQICKQKLCTNKVNHVRLVATEACRQATNGRSFLNKVRQMTGLRFEMIPPKEEARLAVIGAAPHVREDSEQILVVDIGGGSTEMVWIDLRGVDPMERTTAVLNLKIGSKTEQIKSHQGAKVVDWISIPWGVSTLLGQYSDVENDADQFALMSWFFEEQLYAFGPAQAQANNMCPNCFQVIGTSGTVTTVAASHLKLSRYVRDKVDGVDLSAADVDTVVNQYLRLGHKGRQSDPCIGKSREALIMSGAAILQGILRVWPTEKLTVADCGLREGLLFSQMTEQGVWDEV